MNYDDLDYVAREHDAHVGPYINPVDKYNGPIRETTDEESIARDHGVSLGKPVDKREYWGTRENDLITIVNNMIHANSMTDLSNIMNKLPDEAVVKIIEQRYRNSANKLDDRYGLYNDVVKSLGENIYFDFQILYEAMNEKRNFFGETFDISNYVGSSELQDINGLIEAYGDKIMDAGVEIPMIDASTGQAIMNPETNKPYNAIELFEILKNQAYDLSDQLGVQVSQK